MKIISIGLYFLLSVGVMVAANLVMEKLGIYKIELIRKK